MQGHINRRKFIKTTAAGIGGVSALNVCGQNTASQKPLRTALIGCGGRGITLFPAICKEKVVALVDPDKRQIVKALSRVRKLNPDANASKIKTFSDYRKMYDTMAKEIDAVVIATPNHHHAPAALLAIRLGIHTYVEKPMALTIGEARQLRAEAKKCGAPTSIENEEMRGGSDEYYSVSNRIRFDFPARGDMAPVKLYWYDGLAKGQPYSKKTVGNIDCVQPFAMNKPPFVVELEKKYDRNFGTNSSILVGDKGIMTIGTFGSGTRIIPEKAHRAFPKPEATLPRIKGTHQSDFFRACRSGVNACANFDYSVPLVEIVLLGDLAMRAGTGKRIEWDGAAMKCTNRPELNKFIKPEYQNGWKI